MRKVFNSPFTITQAFGARPAYYSQFGLAGHEGIDLVPHGSDFRVLCLADGIVVADDDIAGDPRTDAYGINVTVWHPELNKATRYCHLETNYVVLNQPVSAGITLGVMGATGNVEGAHLHLNLYQTDANGVRLNTNNGYNGGIDPLPFLQENVIISPMDPDKQKGIDHLDQYRKDREQGAEGNYESYANAIIASDKAVPGMQTDLQSAQGEIDRFKGQIDALNATLLTKDQAIESLKQQLQTTQAALQVAVNKPPANGKTYTNPVAQFFIKLADFAER